MAAYMLMQENKLTAFKMKINKPFVDEDKNNP